jgi:exosortase F-associated protein
MVALFFHFKKSMKTQKILLNIALFIGLFLVRLGFDRFSYDPFLPYFKGDFEQLPFPELSYWLLAVWYSLRFVANTLLSLCIVFVWTENLPQTQSIGKMLGLFFVFMLALFLFLASQKFPTGYFLPFYIRRFLIHPLFLLVLLPWCAHHYFSKKE